APREAQPTDAARDVAGETRDAALDTPADASPDTLADAPQDTPSESDASSDGPTCAALGPPPRRFAIGVVESPAGVSFLFPDGGMVDAITDCVNRITGVFGGYADIERIPIASIDSRLSRYDLVVLCSDWAEYDWDKITPHAAAFTTYVTGGGGFLMYQPNKT